MDGLSIDGIIRIINQVAFPIVVAIWFMYRSDKRQDKAIELLTELLAIERVNDKKEK